MDKNIRTEKYSLVNPLVSIIIPVFNSEKYLAEAIQSALDQTWSNKEIIIVDDGSTDSSLSVAKTFESEIVKVFSQKNNGASSARNKGLQESTGDFIQFLDADDLLMPGKIETQIKQLNNSQDKLSICPVIHFNRFNTNISSLMPTSKELTLYKDHDNPFEFLINLYDIKNGQAAIIPIHSWLTPKKLLNPSVKWNESQTVNDDGEFFCRVVLSSTGIVATKDTFCYYRKYAGEEKISLSGRKDLKSLESHYHSLLLIREHLLQVKNNDTRINSIIADNLMNLLMQSYPEHKTLTKKIKTSIGELGNTGFSPVLGGRVVEAIKNTFGWKIARLLQHCYKLAAIK